MAFIRRQPAARAAQPGARLLQTFGGAPVGTGLIAATGAVNAAGPLVITGAPRRVATPLGTVAWEGTGTQMVRAASVRPLVLGTDEFISLVCVFRKRSTAIDANAIAGLGATGGGSGNTLLYIRGHVGNAPQITIDVRDSAGQNYIVGGDSSSFVDVTDLRWHTVAYSTSLTKVGGNSSIRLMYIDGREELVGAAEPYDLAATTFDYVCATGSYRGAAEIAQGDFEVAMFVPLHGRLDKQALRSLSVNPWQLLAGSTAKRPLDLPSVSTYVYSPSGGLSFAGAAATSKTSSGPTTYTYSPSGGITFSGNATTSLNGRTVISTDGAWTWFNDERVRYYNGHYYVGYVTSAGDIGITKYNATTGAKSSYTLAAGFEEDDHDNPSIYILPDGKIVAAYCKHNVSQVNVRVSTNSEDITSWTDVVYTNGSFSSYANIYKCGAYYWIFFRPGTGFQDYVVRTTDFATFGTPTKIIDSNTAGVLWPYVKYCQNGDDRIDAFYNTGHPNQELHPDLYHIYFTESGGDLVPHKSDGTTLTLPVLTTDGTQVFDSGTTTSAWVWQVRPDWQGYPCVLFARFQTTSDHRAMFSRWTGSAWSSAVEIASMGTYLLSTEYQYSGGMTFDGNNRNRVYLSKQVGSYWEIQEYETTDSGANWSKTRDVTSGSTVKNCRPYSPIGHQGKAVFWWSGTYTAFTNFDTDILAADGEVDSDAPTSYTYSASGGITLSGAAAASFTSFGVTSYSYVPIGGITFAGAAATAFAEYVPYVSSVTITLVNESGTPQTGLSSLKWCWFDEVTPNLFNAPTDKGSAESTDGSGVLTIPLPNTNKSSGQVGWLIVTNSDGTTMQSPAHRAFSGPMAVD
jgi:hypothetical protein